MSVNTERRAGVSASTMAVLMLAAFIAAGMIRFPIVSRAAGGHIEYDSPHFVVGPVIAGYLAAKGVSMLLSSHKTVNLSGIAALLSFVASYAAYTQWFFSSWFFFAAILNGIVFLRFTAGLSSSEEAANRNGSQRAESPRSLLLFALSTLPNRSD